LFKFSVSVIELPADPAVFAVKATLSVSTLALANVFVAVLQRYVVELPPLDGLLMAPAKLVRNAAVLAALSLPVYVTLHRPLMGFDIEPLVETIYEIFPTTMVSVPDPLGGLLLVTSAPLAVAGATVCKFVLKAT
jgi:hypothetical protein